MRSKYRNNQNRPSRPPTNWLGRLLMFAIALVVLTGVGFVLVRDSIHQSIPDQISKKLSESLPPEIQATIGRASFVEGVGFEIADLVVTETNPQTSNDAIATPILSVGHASIHAPLTTAELCVCDVVPQKLVINQASLHFVRNRDQSWNIDALLEHFAKQKHGKKPLVPIEIHNSTIELTDHSQTPALSLTLQDANLVIQPQTHDSRKLIQVSGACSHRLISKIGIEVFIDPASSEWFVRYRLTDAVLSPDLMALLPVNQIQSQLPQADLAAGLQSLSGNLNSEGTIEGKSNNLSKFMAKGNVNRLAVVHREIPQPISGASLAFRVDQDGFQVDRATGRIGDGTFRIAYRQQGFMKRSGWDVSGSLENFLFDHRWEKWLPASCEKFCREYNPAGTSNIQFRLARVDGKLEREINSQLLNIAFLYERFPYPMSGMRGTVHWLGDVCKFNVHGQEQGQKVSMEGTITNPGNAATYQINLGVDGALPVDRKMQHALRAIPSVHDTVASFRPSGRVGGTGQITKTRSDQARPSKSFDIRLYNCFARHEAFDYPIEEINGIVEYRDEKTQFKQLTGRRGTAAIECDGEWSPNHGLELRFLCKQVPFDETLRRAISPTIREVWDSIRPQGSVDLLRVDLKKLPGQYVETSVDATLHSVSPRGEKQSDVAITPEWFPYRVDQMSGNIKVGDGRVQLTDIAGKHGRTWLVWKGDGRYSSDIWSVTLKDLLVGSLKADRDLLDALPDSLAPSVRQMKLDGLLTVSGQLTMSGKSQPTSTPIRRPTAIAQVNYLEPTPAESTTALEWDLNFDLEQANLYLGTPIKNAFGNVNIRGIQKGSFAEGYGTIAIDSLTMYGSQITKLRGPFRINQSEITLGTFASPLSSQIQPESIVGSVYGGRLRFDGKKSTLGDENFYLQASVSDGRLRQITSQLAPHAERVTGRTFANLRLNGRADDVRSYRGAGTLQLRDAAIYELPVMLSMFKLLKIKQVNRTLFDTSNVDFTVAGENVNLNRIELIGDAISLIGNGNIGFDHELALNFYTVMGRGRFYIPLLSELYRAGAKQILWITVDGTLGDPRTHRHVLPHLNDSIRQLFEPPTPTVLGESSFQPAQIEN